MAYKTKLCNTVAYHTMVLHTISTILNQIIERILIKKAILRKLLRVGKSYPKHTICSHLVKKQSFCHNPSNVLN